MSTAIAEILGQVPRYSEARGRLVLNMTGDIQSLVSGHKTEEHIERERALIVQTIRRLGGASCDMLAEETGIVHEHVSARLAWLRKKGLVECWKAKGRAVWKMTEDTA